MGSPGLGLAARPSDVKMTSRLLLLLAAVSQTAARRQQAQAQAQPAPVSTNCLVTSIQSESSLADTLLTFHNPNPEGPIEGFEDN